MGCRDVPTQYLSSKLRMHHAKLSAEQRWPSLRIAFFFLQTDTCVEVDNARNNYTTAELCRDLGEFASYATYVASLP